MTYNRAQLKRIWLPPVIAFVLLILMQLIDSLIMTRANAFSVNLLIYIVFIVLSIRAYLTFRRHIELEIEE